MAVFALQVSDFNPEAYGLLVAMMFLPSVLFGWLAAGVLDRWNKKRFLVLSDVFRALLVLSIPLVGSLAWAAAAIFIAYLLDTAYLSTVQAVTPELAGDEETNARGMARLGQGQSLAQFLAYISAALLISWVGLTYAFAIDAFTFVLSAALLFSIRVPASVWRAQSTEDKSGFVEQIKEGAGHVRHNPVVLALVVILVPIMLALQGVNTAVPAATRSLWHEAVANYSWIMLAIALGTFVGMRLLEEMADNLPFRRLIGGGFIAFGVLAALYAYVGSIWSAIAISFFGGMANAAFLMSAAVWTQQVTPQSVRARVMVFRRGVMGAGAIVGALAGGWLAEVASLQAVFLGGGAVAVVGGLVAFTLPALRAKSDHSHIEQAPL